MSSQNVEERVVEMRIDNDKFESGAKQTISTLEKLERALHLKSDTSAIDNLEKSVSKFDASPMSNSLEKVSMSFSALEIAGMRVISNLTDSVYNFTAKTLKELTVEPVTAGWSKIQDKNSSVQTIMNSTGDSLQEVNGYLDKLMRYSDETSFSFTDMTKALATMTSTGGDVKKLIPMIMGIGNSVAYAGKGAAEFQRAIFNLNQSYSGGFLTLMDWKSLQGAGVNSKALMEVLIRSAEELGKIEKGTITINNFTEKLKDKWADTEVMERGFGYFAEMTTEAFKLVDQGVYKNVTEAYQALAESFDDVQSKAALAAQQAKSFREVIDAIKDSVSTGWMTTFEKIFGNFEEQVKFWTDMFDPLYDIFGAGGETRNDLLEFAFGKNSETGGVKEASVQYEKFNEQLTKLGYTSEDFEKICTEINDTLSNTSMAEIIKQYGSFENAVKKGAIGVDILQKAIEKLTGKKITQAGDTAQAAVKKSTKTAEENLEELTAVAKRVMVGEFGSGEERKKAIEALGYDYEAVQKLVNWMSVHGYTTVDTLKVWYPELYGLVERGITLADKEVAALDQVNQEMNEASNLYQYLSNEQYNAYGKRKSGGELFRESLLNIAQTASNVVNIFRSAFESVFGTVEERGERIYNFLERFNKFTKNLKDKFDESVNPEGVLGLQKVFESLLRVLKVITSLVGSGFKIAFSLIKGVFNLVYSLLQLIGGGEFSIGEFLDNMADALSNVGELTDKIAGIFNFLADKIRELAPQVKKIFSGDGTLLEKLQKIRDLFSKSIKNTTFYKDLNKDGTLFNTINKKLAVMKTFFSDIGDETKDNTNTISNVLFGLFPTFEKWYNNLKKEQKGGLITFVLNALDTIGILIRMIIRRADSLFTNIGNKMSELRPKIKEIFDNKDLPLFSRIKDSVKEVLAAFNPFEGVRDKLDAIWDDKNEDGFFRKIIDSFLSIIGITREAEDEVDTFSEKFEKKFPKLSAWFEANKDTSIFAKGLASVFNVFDKINIDKIDSFFTDIGQFIKFMFEGLFGEDGDKTIVERVSNFVVATFNGIIEGIKKIDFKQLLEALKFGLFAAIAYEIITNLNELKEIPKTFKEVLGDLGDMFRDVGMYFKAKAFLQMAISIAVLTAAIYALTKIPEQDLTRIVSTIIALLLVINLLIKSFQKTTIYNGNIDIKKIQLISNLGSALIGFSIAAIAIASAIYKIASIEDPKALWRAVAVVGGFIIGLTVIISILSKLSRTLAAENGPTGDYLALLGDKNFSKKYTDASVGIRNCAIAMAIIAVAVNLLIRPVKQLLKLTKTFSVEQIGLAILGIVLLVGTIVAATALIAKYVRKSTDTTKIGTEMLKIAASMLIIALAVKMMLVPIMALTALAGVSANTAIGSLILLIGLIIALVAPLAVMAKLTNDFKSSSLAFLAVAASILIIALAINMLITPITAIAALGDKAWSAVGAIAILLTLFTIMSMVLASDAIKNPKKLIIVAAAIFILAAALTVLSPALVAITTAFSAFIAITKQVTLTWKEWLKLIGLVVILDLFAVAMLGVGLAALAFGVGVSAIGAGLLLTSIAIGIFAKSLDVLTEKLPKFITALGEMASDKFSKSIQRLLIIFLAFAIGIGIVTIALAKLVSAIAKVSKSSGKLDAKSFGARIVEFGQAIINAIAKIFIAIGQAVISHLPAIGKLLIVVGSILGLYLLNIIPTWADTLVLAILVLFETIHQSLRANKQNIEHTIFGIVEFVGEIFLDAIAWVAKSIVTLIGKSIDITLGTLLDPIIELLDKPAIKVGLKTLLGPLADGLIDTLKDLRVNVGKTVEGFTSTIDNAVEEMEGSMRDLVPEATTYVHADVEVRDTTLSNYKDELEKKQEEARAALAEVGASAGAKDGEAYAKAYDAEFVAGIGRTPVTGGPPTERILKEGETVKEDAYGHKRVYGTGTVTIPGLSKKEVSEATTTTLEEGVSEGVSKFDIGNTLKTAFLSGGNLTDLFKEYVGGNLLSSEDFASVLGLDKDTMSLLGGDLMSGLGNGIKGGSDDVLNELLNVAENGYTGFTESPFVQTNSPSKAYEEVGGHIDEGLAEGIRNNASSPIQAMIELANTIYDEFYDKVLENAEKIDQITPDFANTEVSDVEYDVEIVQDTDALQEDVSSIAVDTGTLAINKLSDTIDSESSKVTSSVKKVVDASGRELDLMRSEGYEGGTQLGIGAAQGINSSQSYVVAAAANLGRAATNAYRLSLGIRSPSKVFEYISSFIPMGAAEGIENNQDYAIESIVGLGSSMIEAMRRSMAQVGYIASDEFDFRPSITPVVDLSEASVGANRFNSMFRNGQIESTLKGIGDVSKMRIDAGSINYNNQNGDVVNEIRLLSDRMDRLGDAVSNMKMVLDTGILVGEITPGVNKNLGAIAIRDRRR